MKPACRGGICSADEDGSRLRFVHRRCASYILMLDEQSSQAQNVLHILRQRRKMLHKSLTMKHCFRLHFITPRQAAKAEGRLLRFPGKLTEYPTQMQLSF